MIINNNTITHFEAFAYRIPTELAESDGTFEWDSTTIIIVKLWCNSIYGLGYTYSDESIVALLYNKCKPIVLGKDPDSFNSIVLELHTAMRNLGDTGLSSMAIAAVDNALWDLRAKIHDLPLVKLIGQVRDRVQAYVSGGFTSYTINQLRGQLSTWADNGFGSVKMKIGRDKCQDKERIKESLNSIGQGVSLFVDANGAYDPKEACEMSRFLADKNITWFEEPVHHRDHTGLNFVRNSCSNPVRVVSGEYGFVLDDFKNMIESLSVDIIQADATRCGITDFLKVASLCDIYRIPFSSHTAPSLHTHLCCAVNSAINVEYFHDHIRIEQMLFDGVIVADKGWVKPDLSAIGNGLILKEADIQKYRV